MYNHKLDRAHEIAASEREVTRQPSRWERCGQQNWKGTSASTVGGDPESGGNGGRGITKRGGAVTFSKRRAWLCATIAGSFLLVGRNRNCFPLGA